MLEKSLPPSRANRHKDPLPPKLIKNYQDIIHEDFAMRLSWLLLVAVVGLLVNNDLFSMEVSGVVGYRASILHFLHDPDHGRDGSYQYFEDGLLIVENGHVQAVGSFSALAKGLPKDTPIEDYSGRLIMPGFVDAHVHYPQSEMIAAYGEQLLQWLHTYTFPTERKYSDYSYARVQADFFLDQLLRNGTTTALVFATVHPASVDAFFDASLARNMRMISGKVLMDQNAPEYLLDTPEKAYKESRALIEKWRNKGRLGYAITPRFAPTSSSAQLEAAGRLRAEFPETYVHSHIAENVDEVAWVKKLHPQRKNYFDVYDHYGLSGPRSVFAHGIHLGPKDEVKAVLDTQSVIVFCPTSNLFLGSGLFPFRQLRDQGVRVAMGTDVGAGTSFSMLETLDEAYKVAQLQKARLSPLEGFYLATLGGAKALSLDDKIGNFLPGKEADFVVLDPHATPLSNVREANSQTLDQKLFVMMKLGDDRHVLATYIAGDRLYRRK